MLSIEQQEIRKKGLGATDCAAVMGLSPYKTPYELWLQKTGRQSDTAILSEDRLRLRHAHEETIAREYAFQREVKLKRVNQTVFHKKFPFMLCNLDRVIIGQRKIVECKSSTGFMRAAWGLSGSDEAPIHYILQVQHQMACTGYEEADIAALIDIDDYRIFPTPRNDKVIQKIEDSCERFWLDHVLADIPPAPTTRGDLKLMYPLNNGSFIDVQPSIKETISFITNIKSDIKNMSKDIESAEKEIIQFIADKDGITEEGKVIVTFQANKNGVRSLRIK
jgi:putative phage-type endonuclease